MDDLISRQEAIDRLSEKQRKNDNEMGKRLVHILD